MRPIVAIALVLIISGCIALPATRDSKHADCDLVTRQMYLEVHGSPGIPGPITYTEADLIVLAAIPVIFTASVVISGSIVLIGNTLHWIEAKGRCDSIETDLILIDESDSLLCNRKNGKCEVIRESRTSSRVYHLVNGEPATVF